jgi:hypothetical protein
MRETAERNNHISKRRALSGTLHVLKTRAPRQAINDECV